jgi:outer membrane protein TolC
MHPSHKLTLIAVVLAISFNSLAQQAPEKKIHYINAQEAANLAFENRVEILNAKLDIKNQEAFNKEVTGLALPQITANMSVGRNFNIPVTVLPDFISPAVYNVLENEDVRNGSGDPVKWDGIINTFPARFGVPWQAAFQASVQQIIFQPEVFVALKAREGAMELYETQLKVAQDSVKYNVYLVYYGVLVAEKGLEFARGSKSRLTKLLSDQEAFFKAGFIERLDLDRTKVNLNNISTTVANLENTVTNAYAALKFALAVPQSDSLHLMDTLSRDWIEEDIFSFEETFEYNQRFEIQALRKSEELQKLQVKRFKMSALPTVSAQWNLATNAQRNRFTFFDAGDRWFFSNIVGVNVSVPITDGWQRHNRVKQAQYSLEKTRNSIDRFQQAIDYQIINTRNSLSNAIVALNNQEENKALAERVFETTKIKYEQGLGSSFEVLQAETDLQVALTNYYQALYNAGVARITYMQSLGQMK